MQKIQVFFLILTKLYYKAFLFVWQIKTLKPGEERCPMHQINICINYIRKKNINFKIQTFQTVLFFIFRRFVGEASCYMFSRLEEPFLI